MAGSGAANRHGRAGGDATRTISQRALAPPRFSTSITLTPCAAWALRTLAALQVAMPSGCSKPSSTYSWFITNRPALLLPGISGCLKKWMPSWCMPSCASCSAALLLASNLNVAVWPAKPTGSPQAAITCTL
jgi:hypothetical protein